MGEEEKNQVLIYYSNTKLFYLIQFGTQKLGTISAVDDEGLTPRNCSGDLDLQSHAACLSPPIVILSAPVM